MKALVTGGSGFLGRHIIRELLKQGIDTIAFDENANAGPAGKKARGGATCKAVQGDVLDASALGKAMKGCDLVFHTAAIADIDAARKIPVRTMEVNVVGTTACLEAARKAKVDRFLFASSVYTGGTRGSFYRVSKQAGESLCRVYSDEFDLPTTILKYGSLYGREPNHWNFIYRVCRELLETGRFAYTSSPEAVREYIHINDAARETVRIARDPAFANRSVLITGHQRMKMGEFFDMVQEILGRPIAVTYAPPEDQQHYVITPYAFETEIPLRVNLSTYVDISEGILDCLREVQKELDREKGVEGRDS
ncbi:MAG TPA: NAD(P)-dependent oxidoreductase [Methanomicrobiales archaeon]|nr:NAD(P)-dependent oxidoreductase [Methanomicrobiales archaeon]